MTSIIIPDWTCNDKDYVTFDFSRFSTLESIEIGNNCFGSVEKFKIDGLSRLKTIRIGSHSFTQKKKYWGSKEWKSFQILNCRLLESFQIGEYSFSDFAGDFELKNLPQLLSIEIGTIGKKSCNFYYSDIKIDGIDIIVSISND